jgi:hypothetical protein
MAILALYALLTTAAAYLGYRAMITKFLWSRYPPWLNYYMGCTACSGLLYGIAVAVAIGLPYDLPFLGLPGRSWVTIPVVGLGSMVWTPILAYVHVYALLGLGVGDPRAEEPPTESQP